MHLVIEKEGYETTEKKRGGVIELEKKSITTSGNYLLKIYDSNEDKSGYINTAGDTIVPIGYYADCLTDTIRVMGVVVSQEFKFLAINSSGKELFEVYFYDNGPDYVSVFSS
jgi:hypothetical protein